MKIMNYYNNAAQQFISGCASAETFMADLTVLFICPPGSRFLTALKALPPEVKLFTGDTPEAFSKEARAEARVVLFNGSLGPILQKIYHDLPRVEWLHCLSAGLDAVLTPEMVQIPVPLTNSRGVYARSLSEFALAGMLYFAKNLNRMRDAQRAQKWEQFDIEELHGRVLGIIGYGEIGRRTAERAKPFGMQIHILRRRPELTAGDPLIDRVYGGDELEALIAASDYLLVSAPLTRETRGMVGAAQLAKMKSSSVLINLGRGPVIVESALVEALRQEKIRGAVLDVFNEEPLPAGHPFYSLDNVLLSPHCADHTATWMEEAMLLFLENIELFRAGKPLKNIADKKSGY
jgi:phosphoglycerate dehydrogenase-like enzyme